MNNLNPFRNLIDDELLTPEVGPWAEEKYRLLYNYARMFATSMKKAWDQRVYIDLFSAAGRSKIRDTDRTVLSSPLLALEIPDQFDKYIFCEENEECIEALKKRVSSDHPTANVQYIEGDVNQRVDKVIDEMPQYGPEHRVLGFCFVDPCKMRDIRFTTLQRIAQRYIDFLVLIPTGMDAGRNVDKYIKESNKTVDEFLGIDDWREQWQVAITQNVGFDMFIAEMYSTQMKRLEYRFGGLNESVLIRSREKYLPLYRLGFYCRHDLGERFWQETKKYSIGQQNLFE